MIFQNSQDSLDPRQSVARILQEAAAVVGSGGADAPLSPSDALSRVGLSSSYLKRRASQLSGGQAQRVAIARAIATRPSLLILDEPVSALDVSLQSQILNLLIDLQRETGTSYLFVTHDLAVARQVADRVAVMHDGRIIELGSAQDVLAGPAHPYTRALIDAVPRLGTRGPAPAAESTAEPATVDSDLDEIGRTGCAYRPRCVTWLAQGKPAVCVDVAPQLELFGTSPTGHDARCHFALPADETSRRGGRVRVRR
jgi:oligopeptide/dipeptide ABC transporter ATP-binding protein